ncbi:outer membrane lipoprotein-sorting protein [bacterium]|nr:outer membrane lipoprotein-sorting protein [bacterium]
MKPLTILFSILVLFSASAFAYDINDLIADAKARYGQAYEEMTDMTIKQQATVKDNADEAAMSMTMYRKGDKWRNEALIGGEEGFTATTIFDGTDVWSMTMGMKTKLPKDQTEMTGMAEAYWKDIPDNAKMLGEENLNGRDCWIVEWNEDPESAEPVKTWIDKKDFMHVQTLSQRSGKTTKIVNSDFRKVKGEFMIPYLTEVYSDDKLVMTSTINEFTFNTGLSDDLFNPELLGGSEMDMQNLDLDAIMKQAEEMKKKFGGEGGAE